jgi:hypothetical protein
MNPQTRLAYAASLSILCLAGLTAPAAVKASDLPAGVAAQIPAAWRYCNTARECSVIAFDCSGRFSVNRRYKSEAERIIYATESAAWAACNMPVTAGMTSTCQANLCEVISGPDDIRG